MNLQHVDLFVSPPTGLLILANMPCLSQNQPRAQNKNTRVCTSEFRAQDEHFARCHQKSMLCNPAIPEEEPHPLFRTCTLLLLLAVQASGLSGKFSAKATIFRSHDPALPPPPVPIPSNSAASAPTAFNHAGRGDRKIPARHHPLPFAPYPSPPPPPKTLRPHWISTNGGSPIEHPRSELILGKRDSEKKRSRAVERREMWVWG